MTAEIIPGMAKSWLVDPRDAASLPYVTHKPEVAERRDRAGDTVTPIVRECDKPAAPTDEEF